MCDICVLVLQICSVLKLIGSNIALSHSNILLILTIELCNAKGLDKKIIPGLREPPAGLCVAASLTRRPDILVAKVPTFSRNLLYKRVAYQQNSTICNPILPYLA